MGAEAMVQQADVAVDADPARDVDALLSRLESVGADSDLPPNERAEALGQVERELFRFLRRHADDAALTGDLGHPALSLLEDWRDEADRLDLPDAARRSDALLEELIDDEAERWARGAQDLLADATLTPGERADRCFRLLLEATQLDREALARDEDDEFEPPMRRHRDGVRAELDRIVEAHPPTEQQRAAWGRELVDVADVVLTSIDDLNPARAVRHLQFVADDLTWYLAHVETQRGKPRRRLRRKLRRLRVEIQERELQSKLEDQFGTRAVALFERLILWLIFLVLGILVVELSFDLSPRVSLALAIADTAACAVFLWEFFFKLFRVRGKASWFARHFFIDFLPSLPFGLFTVGHHVGADNSRFARALRLLRITRMARYLRLLMPLIRMIRAYGFLSRGLDRLVRRYGSLLNRNVILFPTRTERRAGELRGEASVASNLWRLRARMSAAWMQAAHDTPREERAAIFQERIDVLTQARTDGDTRRPPRAKRKDAPVIADIPVEVFANRLDAVTPEEIEADMGKDFVARCARVTRLFSKPPIRWFPVIRRVVPRLSPTMTDAEVTSAAAHGMARGLKQYTNRVFWLADLYGTVTPAEFVDRVGTAMVKAAMRPARKLVLLGLAWGVLALFVEVLGFEGSKTLSWVESFLGALVAVLGGLCLVVLGIGWWMRNIAGQATSFLEQTAHAQYLALTEAIKGRHLKRDAHLLTRRVLAPEALVCPAEHPPTPQIQQDDLLRAVKRWLVEPQSGTGHQSAEAVERVVLLYRDSLDGALFGESDVRTTSQLLGDPSLQQMRNLSRRVGRKDVKALQKLDLTRRRTAIRGPYIWLSFVSKSITHNVARLIVDYNRHAISLKELPYAAAAERQAYDRWIESEPGRPSDEDVERLRATTTSYQTTSFKALNFLDDDPTSDEEVRIRYGGAVLDRLRQDRRILIREIFGTAPRHLRPKEQRLVNLYRVYQRWLQGGRAFFIPLRVIWRALKGVGAFVRWILRAIAEVRRPQHHVDENAVREADFATASRKIGRMRGPIVWATIRLRAQFDPEYLGVRIPGAERTGLEGHDIEADLPFVDADPSDRRAVDELRRATRADLRRLSRLVDAGLLSDAAASAGMPADAITKEHVRAASIAYCGDYRGVRSLLSCERLLDEAAADAEHRPLERWSWWPRPKLKRMFRRWWKSRGGGHPRARKALWREIARDVDGLADALQAWGGPGPQAARREGMHVLGEFLRHPGRITEQLVTLRAVQTLALVDLLNYRVQVYRLGRYEETGDEASAWLSLGQSESSAAR